MGQGHRREVRRDRHRPGQGPERRLRPDRLRQLFSVGLAVLNALFNAFLIFVLTLYLLAALPKLKQSALLSWHQPHAGLG